jgi:uncharacterized protein YjbI with pentapeptide repeats
LGNANFEAANMRAADLAGADIRGAKGLPRLLFEKWLAKLQGSISFRD